MITFVEKLEYITRYRKEDGAEFIQHWPDAEGNFDPVAYFKEASISLATGKNPIVPAGATSLLLSELMTIRIKQQRSILIPSELNEALEELERVIQG